MNPKNIPPSFEIESFFDYFESKENFPSWEAYYTHQRDCISKFELDKFIGEENMLLLNKIFSMERGYSLLNIFIAQDGGGDPCLDSLDNITKRISETYIDCFEEYCRLVEKQAPKNKSTAPNTWGC